MDHVLHVFGAIRKNYIAKIGSYLQDLNCQPLQPLLLTGEVQNMLKRLYLEVKLSKWLG